MTTLQVVVQVDQILYLVLSLLSAEAAEVVIIILVTVLQLVGRVVASVLEIHQAQWLGQLVKGMLAGYHLEILTMVQQEGERELLEAMA
ncbi:hypothetical protein COY62_01270 [bacterium (Candidatus Howlettbacteria) CG_4_10_14_0_8_um_filter_40_9]|nr:MAG: hypothetical protein COY62_01270 [bacterium (Candidatus Howlettbacteria) CG_4_10_14_0_8_um_filter_40_9]